MQSVGSILDDRERALADVLSSRHPGLTVRCQRLLIGDVQIVQDGRIAFVLERKTRSDLHASLVDGRFASQRARMVREYGIERCGYVIEGGSDWAQPESGAEIALVVRDRVPLFWARDVSDTADLIARLARSVLAVRSSPPTPVARAPSDARARMDAGTVDDRERVCTCLLRCIPGVSERRAATIAERFGSMGGLAVEIARDASSVQNAISEMTDRRSGRRFGPQVAARIVDCISVPAESGADAHSTPPRSRRVPPGRDAVMFTSFD